MDNACWLLIFPLTVILRGVEADICRRCSGHGSTATRGDLSHVGLAARGGHRPALQWGRIVWTRCTVAAGAGGHGHLAVHRVLRRRVGAGARLPVAREMTGGRDRLVPPPPPVLPPPAPP